MRKIVKNIFAKFAKNEKTFGKAPIEKKIINHLQQLLEFNLARLSVTCQKNKREKNEKSAGSSSCHVYLPVWGNEECSTPLPHPFSQNFVRK